MSDEFVKELFEGLKRTNTAYELNQALDRLRQADSSQVSELAASVLQLLRRYSEELASRSENKKAGFQFYTGAEILREFFPEKLDDRKHWILSSSSHLEKAAQTYRDFEDMDGAASCMVIASLLRIITGEFSVGSSMENFLESLSDDDYSRAKYASGIVYIPYDLIASIDEQPPDPTRLHRAEQYIESYLLQVPLSQLFTQAVRTAVDLVRNELSNRVKLPKISSEFIHTKDLVFGEEFDFHVKVANSGEGPAQNVSYSLQLDSGLELKKGTDQGNIGSLEVNATHDFSFSLIYAPEGGETQAEKQLSINIAFEDVLQNKRSTIADYQVEFLPYKQSDEFKKQIEKARNNLGPLLEELQKSTEEETFKKLIIGLSELSMKLLDKASQFVETEEFKRVETLVETTNDVVNDFIEPIKDISKDYIEMKQKIVAFSNQIEQSLKNATEALQRAKKKAEEITSRT